MTDQTFWNYEPTPARVVQVIVGPSPVKTWWCAELEGHEREAVEVNYHGDKLYLDNADNEGWLKVTKGRGGPDFSHSSLPVSKVLTGNTQTNTDALVERCKVPPPGWWCSRNAGHEGPCAARSTAKIYDEASVEVDRLIRELDITNADHIALWLEYNLPVATLGWLAVQIVEAHEATTQAAQIAALTEALDKAATRLDHCAVMIAGSFDASGALRAERTVKAKHYALEARTALKGADLDDHARIVGMAP